VLAARGGGGRKNSDKPMCVCASSPKKVRMSFFFYFVSLDYFIAFLGVAEQGGFKNAIKPFWGKSMSKTFYTKH
jgi:hypothetical protein